MAMKVEKYSTAARNMMEGMGWKEGDGLGKERQGRTNALKPRKKIDNRGLGSKRDTGKWLDACCAYDNILQKLNVVYGGEDQDQAAEDDKKERKRLRKEEKKRKRAEAEAEGVEESDEAPPTKKSKKDKKDKKSKKEKKDKKEKAVVEETEKDSDHDSSDDENEKPVPVARHLIYAKRLKAKRVEGYSDNHKAEIFASIQRQVRSEQIRKDKYALPALSARSVPEADPSESEEEEEQKTVTATPVRSVVGFTEDTQVDIYNAAMDKQIKGRTGLGVAKKLSKSKRREAASATHHLTRIGQYLSRKFVSAGNLDEVHRKI